MHYVKRFYEIFSRNRVLISSPIPDIHSDLLAYVSIRRFRSQYRIPGKRRNMYYNDLASQGFFRMFCSKIRTTTDLPATSFGRSRNSIKDLLRSFKICAMRANGIINHVQMAIVFSKGIYDGEYGM